ncbi:MAG: hypothetical protein JWN04_2774 [Myxococcaceae bacterium]|nr:hypothetical protein [Myxococcaceae bacterium]
MSSSLRTFLWIVDLSFLLYWLVTGFHLLPASWLYAHHDEPAMVAWNFSFWPLDLVVSATGLSAVALWRRGRAGWAPLALLSLAFTSASGLNAVAFWALRGEFDLGWWLPNLVLLAGPWPFILQLVTNDHDLLGKSGDARDRCG